MRETCLGEDASSRLISPDSRSLPEPLSERGRGCCASTTACPVERGFSQAPSDDRAGRCECDERRRTLLAVACTHVPKVMRAFPDHASVVADGDARVFSGNGKGGAPETMSSTRRLS